MTRSVGILLVPALAIEAFSQGRRGRDLLPRLISSAAVAAGPLLYSFYWKVQFGDFWAPVHAQRNWGRDISWPWTTLSRAITYAGQLGSYWLVDLLVAGAVLVAVAAGIRWLRPTYLLYAVASLLLPLCYSVHSRPLLSMPRFVIVIFPAFWVLARATERRFLPESLVIGVSAAGYGILSLLFVNWWHIF
jgi:hypothetical protein